MRKFDYIQLSTSSKTPLDISKELKKLGDQGWELVLGHGPSNCILIFKREMEEDQSNEIRSPERQQREEPEYSPAW
jgi:hypothetical protein